MFFLKVFNLANPREYLLSVIEKLGLAVKKELDIK
jgi:hypothetical protein